MTVKIICDLCYNPIHDSAPRFSVMRFGEVEVFDASLDYDVCSPACLETLGAKLQGEVCS